MAKDTSWGDGLNDTEKFISCYENSVPRQQFTDHVHDEMKHIWESDPRAEGRTDMQWHIRPGVNEGWLYDEAVEEVKAQWVDQGIWKKSWNKTDDGPCAGELWKHEDPLSEAPTQNGPDSRFQPKWQAELIREREASRPIHQFFYQVTKQQERLSARDNGDLSVCASDISTQAYEMVRASWIARGIWEDDWGVLPGLTWRHEKPLDKSIAGGLFTATPESFQEPDLTSGWASVAAPVKSTPRPGSYRTRARTEADNKRSATRMEEDVAFTLASTPKKIKMAAKTPFGVQVPRPAKRTTTRRRRIFV
ncbi:hypothetical protein AAE478_010126 [Parahypoxylon ruwenzoriense]